MPASSFTNLLRADRLELKRLAVQVLHDAVSYNSLRLPAKPKSPQLLVPGACFVTLYSGQELRGCIGTYRADNPLWFNVCRYSYYSACEDRRFAPLAAEELGDLRFEISILSELAAIINNGEWALLQQLRVGTDGLLLKEPPRSAIFLPSVWQSLTTPSQFLLALKRKGGWSDHYWSSNMQLFKFTTSVIAGEYQANLCS